MLPEKNESKKPAIITAGKQDVKAPYGLCPKMSRSQAVVVPSHAGMRPPLVAAPQVSVVNMEVPCMGPRCQWWIPEWESCCVRGIARLGEIAAVLEPSKTANLYLNRKINRMLMEIERLSIKMAAIEKLSAIPTESEDAK